MTASFHHGPSGRPPGAGQHGSSATVVIVLAILGCTMLAFCAGLGLLGAVFYARLEAKPGRIPTPFSPPPPAPAPLIAPAWQTEWIANAQLTPVYTAAIDAVVNNKEVLEKLGEPIEPGGEPDALFRREKKWGDRTGTEESIEFDIRGSMGTAVVCVAAGANLQPPGPYRGMWPKTITVMLSDGTEIDVPPPDNKSEPPEQ